MKTQIKIDPRFAEAFTRVNPFGLSRLVEKFLGKKARFDSVKNGLVWGTTLMLGLASLLGLAFMVFANSPERLSALCRYVGIIALPGLISLAFFFLLELELVERLVLKNKSQEVKDFIMAIEILKSARESAGIKLVCPSLCWELDQSMIEMQLVALSSMISDLEPFEKKHFALVPLLNRARFQFRCLFEACQPFSGLTRAKAAYYRKIAP